MICPKCGHPAPWNILDEDSETEVLSSGEESQFEYDKYTIEGKQERSDYITKKRDIILSTTPSLEGYIIEEYIDVISEDVVFRVSFGDSIVNNIKNATSGFSIGSVELKGNTAAIESAKKYVRDKLIAKAISIGANAIVGLDFESSVGNTSFARVSINGTAVKVSRKG